MNSLTQPEIESILTLCLMASFADGEKDGQERQQIKQITESLTSDGFDATRLHQEVLLRRPEISAVVARLSTPGSRHLAYEMAVCVCDADDVCNATEQAFLEELRNALGLSASIAQSANSEAAAIATVPVTPPPLPTVAVPPAPGAALAEETDAMILRYAIVGGALELLPQTMATLAIVPMQTKMVYRIGNARNFELDRKSIAEFMAAIGIGLTSQVFEGFARQLTKGFGKKFGGKLGGQIGDAVGGIAMSFGSTYALGQLAKLYYDSGRTLSMDALKSKYPPLLAEGKALAGKYTGQITSQSQQLQGADIGTLLKGVL